MLGLNSKNFEAVGPISNKDMAWGLPGIPIGGIGIIVAAGRIISGLKGDPIFLSVVFDWTVRFATSPIAFVIAVTLHVFMIALFALWIWLAIFNIAARRYHRKNHDKAPTNFPNR